MVGAVIKKKKKKWGWGGRKEEKRLTFAVHLLRKNQYNGVSASIQNLNE